MFIVLDIYNIHTVEIIGVLIENDGNFKMCSSILYVADWLFLEEEKKSCCSYVEW